MTQDDIQRLHDRMAELAHAVEMHDERMKMEALKGSETMGRLERSVERLAGTVERFVEASASKTPCPPNTLDYNRVILMLVVAIVLSALGQEGVKLLAVAFGLKAG